MQKYSYRYARGLYPARFDEHLSARLATAIAANALHAIPGFSMPAGHDIAPRASRNRRTARRRDSISAVRVSRV